MIVCEIDQLIQIIRKDGEEENKLKGKQEFRIVSAYSELKTQKIKYKRKNNQPSPTRHLLIACR